MRKPSREVSTKGSASSACGANAAPCTTKSRPPNSRSTAATSAAICRRSVTSHGRTSGFVERRRQLAHVLFEAFARIGEREPRAGRGGRLGDRPRDRPLVGDTDDEAVFAGKIGIRGRASGYFESLAAVAALTFARRGAPAAAAAAAWPPRRGCRGCRSNDCPPGTAPPRRAAGRAEAAVRPPGGLANREFGSRTLRRRLPLRCRGTWRESAADAPDLLRSRLASASAVLAGARRDQSPRGPRRTSRRRGSVAASPAGRRPTPAASRVARRRSFARQLTRAATRVRGSPASHLGAAARRRRRPCGAAAEPWRACTRARRRTSCTASA